MVAAWEGERAGSWRSAGSGRDLGAMVGLLEVYGERVSERDGRVKEKRVDSASGAS